jgi:hypothetical protein
MNYQKYVEQLKAQLLDIQASPQYELVGCDIARPQTIEDILEDTEKFISTQYKGMEGFKVWEPFTEFYQATGWIKLLWIYLGQIPKPFKNRFSGSDIYSILEIYDPEAIYSAEENRMVYIPENERLNQPYKVYDEYRMFDRIFLDSYRHVAVKFFRNQEAPIFYYYTLETKSYYKMSIGFGEYLELLLRTRGLSYWQEFFVDDSNFRINLNRAKRFIETLEELFPEVDRTIFESQLAEKRAINLSYFRQISLGSNEKQLEITASRLDSDNDDEKNSYSNPRLSINYQQYIEQLKTKVLEFSASEQYELLLYDIGEPQTLETILEYEESLATEREVIEDFKIWEPFKKFYQSAMWINFRWIYLEQEPNSLHTPYGASRIYSINSVYDPGEIYIPEENRTIYRVDDEWVQQPFKLYGEYRIFDRITMQNENHVAVNFSFDREAPNFYYYSFETKSYYRMSIVFDEYLELLLQTRGLSPWQEFFIDDSNFQLDLARAEQFIKDLELLFPEVDKTIFESQLAKLSGRG